MHRPSRKQLLAAILLVLSCVSAIAPPPYNALAVATSAVVQQLSAPHEVPDASAVQP